MATYFRLINAAARTRVEPSKLPGGFSVSFKGVVLGPAARLLAAAHVRGDRDWTFVGDHEAAYDESSLWEDVTEEEVSTFESRYSSLSGATVTEAVG